MRCRKPPRPDAPARTPKRRSRRFGVAAICVLCLGSAVACGRSPGWPEPGASASELSRKEALGIARNAIKGHISVQKWAPVTVGREGGDYVVTFLNVNPPGAVCGDYAAQVRLDARTGRVARVWAGP